MNEDAITYAMLVAGARAVTETRWRVPGAPLASTSAHADHGYDYACAVCRPDLDDGAQRLARAVLEAALATETDGSST